MLFKTKFWQKKIWRASFSAAGLLLGGPGPSPEAGAAGENFFWRGLLFCKKTTFLTHFSALTLEIFLLLPYISWRMDFFLKVDCIPRRVGVLGNLNDFHGLKKPQTKSWEKKKKKVRPNFFTIFTENQLFTRTIAREITSTKSSSIFKNLKIFYF